MNTIRLCAGCSAPLPPDAPAGLCPQCLLKSAGPTQGGSATGPQSATGPRPVPGQMFGNYRILRLLGQGGMGEVFEAEQRETGRRVALKIMSHAFATEQDRKRFLREGRLAASVNHPNVVYIHGSEEIDGVPVIIMELVNGGTLKDRLKLEGPLSVAGAVETALHLIAGLEAASAAGVLHRDIKPSNCFVTADGVVKVGDFGLSISTLARGESLLTATGSVLGTPAYASPEQLRGEELDARTDIYSVGATLYHLLTGATPFRATDFVKLITEVLDKQPAAPHVLRAEIPAELSRVIQRCLAKDRKARFQSYAELRDALLPFRAEADVPASPARRVLASLVDELAAYGPCFLFLIYWSFDPLDKLARERTLAAALVWAPFFLWYLLYYVIAEGRWGAALGKSICGLRVVGPDRQAPGLARALVRNVVYQAPYILPYFLLMCTLSQEHLRAAHAREEWLITDWLWLPLLILLFATMRRRNGFAAVHDLLSCTRVIVRPRTQKRPALLDLAAIAANANPTPAPPVLAPASALGTFGPYEIRAPLWQRGGEELFLALDPILRRKVWIHRRPSNAAPVSSLRRDLGRAARLRWLAGGQTDTHLWDAYDAVEGKPFLQAPVIPAPWNAVRFWLLDLGEELAQSLQHPETAPALALDRVWITNSGRAMLLDFPCPGITAEPLPVSTLDGLAEMQQFLDRLAQAALVGAPKVPSVPLHARSFLASLSRGAFEKPEFIVGNLCSLAAKPAQVTRAWRLASLSFAPALMLALGILVAGTASFERIRQDRAWIAAYPGKPSLRAVAELYESDLEGQSETNSPLQRLDLTRAFLAHHFADVITNDAAWTRPELREFSQTTRSNLQQAVAGHWPPNPAELAEAERLLPERIARTDAQSRLLPVWIVLGSGIVLTLLFAFLEFVGAAVFGQNLLLRLFGLASVDRSGQPASRPRLVWRWLLTWGLMGMAAFLAAGSVGLVFAANYSSGTEAEGIRAVAIPSAWIFGLGFTGLVTAGTIYTVLHPSRGLQDHLAGTWTVPK